MLLECWRLDVIWTLGNFKIAIFVTLVAVMVPVINYNSDIDTTFFGRSFKVKLLYFIIIIAG